MGTLCVTSVHKVIFGNIFARLGQLIILGNLARYRGGFPSTLRYFLFNHLIIRVPFCGEDVAIPHRWAPFPMHMFYETFWFLFAVCPPIIFLSVEMFEYCNTFPDLDGASSLAGLTSKHASVLSIRASFLGEDVGIGHVVIAQRCALFR